MLITIFAIATTLLVLLTLLPLTHFQVWWVRALDFPRLQLMLIALAMLTAGFLLLELAETLSWALLGSITLCFLYQGLWVVPYTPLFPVEVRSASQARDQPTIRLLTANVLMPNRNAPALLQLIHRQQPDIVLTLESDHWWQKQLDKLETDYPYSLKCALANLYGMHLYSRLPLHKPQIDYLVQADIPSMHALIELPGGHKIRAHFLHPAPPSPTENDSSEPRDAELIIVAKSVTDCELPVIIAGDLNDVAWSKTTRLFRKISGLLDPRIGRGLFNTFHADYWFLRWPLDHLFHSRHFTLVSIRRLGGFDSDHFALLTELLYRTDSPPQTGLEPDREDRALAREKAAQRPGTVDDVPEPEKMAAPGVS